ncbi:MAG: MarR family transcriptional regulator [Burkholderiales bacterium]|nr:MAG: MarR family transcriptional regulator [Burkholderiales bacterium]
MTAQAIAAWTYAGMLALALILGWAVVKWWDGRRDHTMRVLRMLHQLGHATVDELAGITRLEVKPRAMQVLLARLCDQALVCRSFEVQDELWPAPRRVLYMLTPAGEAAVSRGWV